MLKRLVHFTSLILVMIAYLLLVACSPGLSISPTVEEKSAFSTTPSTLDINKTSSPSPTAITEVVTVTQPAPEITNTLESTPESTITATNTPLPSPQVEALPQVSLAVGPGNSDVIPHQIVRARDDRLYIFSMQQYSPLIRLFSTNQPGLPNASSDFFLLDTATEEGYPISIDAVYDGENIIHLLTNTIVNGVIFDYPFDITTGKFREKIQIADDGHSIEGAYIGTSGVSGIVDRDGLLQIVYWTKDEKIRHIAYRYDPVNNLLMQEGADTMMTEEGSANHPVIAISPVDNSLVVAWIHSNEAGSTIQLRWRLSDRDWGKVSTVSNAPVWTSPYFGINIDQGPSMLVDARGIVHLAYIENYDRSNEYGRIHHVYQAADGWVDQALSIYSHDPALALNSRGELFLIGHGHPMNASCTNMEDMCTVSRNAEGSWSDPVLFVAHEGSESFDGSPSVKWSVVGFNRPETIEFVFFQIQNGDYDNPTIFYGRLP